MTALLQDLSIYATMHHGDENSNRYISIHLNDHAEEGNISMDDDDADNDDERCDNEHLEEALRYHVALEKNRKIMKQFLYGFGNSLKIVCIPISIVALFIFTFEYSASSSSASYHPISSSLSLSSDIIPNVVTMNAFNATTSNHNNLDFPAGPMNVSEAEIMLLASSNVWERNQPQHDVEYTESVDHANENTIPYHDSNDDPRDDKVSEEESTEVDEDAMEDTVAMSEAIDVDGGKA